ncbi:MAG: tRNA lysidine(34) synthetase TilS [Candidatus Deferrimicrobium sp.]
MPDMPSRRKKPGKPVIVAAVSGGPDSVYLLRKLSTNKGRRVVVGHVNYGTRGIDSVKDQELVEDIARTYGYDTEILVYDMKKHGRGFKSVSGTRGNFPVGFEKKAREIRYRFLKDLSEKVGAEAIALAHTADDQVETILMRVFEGAGIGGLKGIPRETGDGIVRPILDVWKEDILGDLKRRKIPYRIDRSNADTRFERNWVRHVLLPLLVKRYGKPVKKRIFTLGERFRELDDYLEAEAVRWIRRNAGMSDRVVFRRKTFSALPSVLRVKILQRICFDRLEVAPNERLLRAMDGNVCKGGPSARVNAGKGWKLANRYEEALFVPEENARSRKTAGAGSGKKAPIPIATPGEYEIPLGRAGRIVTFAWVSWGKGTAAQAKRLAANGDAEVFDAACLTLPLTVRPLRAGDRIRPFGSGAGRDARDGGKKVKEILIDRKIPRDDRWGRPVVCDARGAILWIPGVLRSAHAPVTPETRKTALLRIRAEK